MSLDNSAKENANDTTQPQKQWWEDIDWQDKAGFGSYNGLTPAP